MWPPGSVEKGHRVQSLVSARKLPGLLSVFAMGARVGGQHGGVEFDIPNLIQSFHFDDKEYEAHKNCSLLMSVISLQIQHLREYKAI